MGMIRKNERKRKEDERGKKEKEMQKGRKVRREAEIKSS